MSSMCNVLHKLKKCSTLYVIDAGIDAKGCKRWTLASNLALWCTAQCYYSTVKYRAVVNGDLAHEAE